MLELVTFLTGGRRISLWFCKGTCREGQLCSLVITWAVFGQLVSTVWVSVTWVWILLGWICIRS